MSDKIVSIELSYAALPLHTPISDAKVLTGRQKPLTQVAFLFAEITTEGGLTGLGFSYSKRAGGPALYAHAREVAPNLIGEDPSDIGRLWTKLVWAGASVGRSGVATQAIAALDVSLWDLKAKRAKLPLGKLLGVHRDRVDCYNTSGGFLSTPLEDVLDNVEASIAAGIGGIKIKVGHPDPKEDLKRLDAVARKIDGRVALMVDANQQWDRHAAMRMGRAFEQYGLTWIEEPLDAYDAEGHKQLADALDTPIASGEMLASSAEHLGLIASRAVDFVQPDAPRVGGVTQFMKVLAAAEQANLSLAPHFAMEIHVHLAAAYPHTTWVEHFDWLEPLFDERQILDGGCIVLPDRAGLGLTLSGQARAWTTMRCTINRAGISDWTI
ncbi:MULTISPECIES: L-talarate/galactarate dehydratase [unclassified Sphingobium]|uniref:L-talarate/galactarate dehydratase n=1 Tax=unclassified Sphingobium TaxID=2611147 RepID=UPI0029CABD61|nr:MULTISPECIES: mandelate racemase/muconate lactonizing enzyme family protein [unclassified Sphingobium]MCW2395747.1 L-alanine-DL-glutamate epimerase-like enolase superfamily enzyme [Sphingobium sp. B8D3B]MCW2419262.1 L-alanine-DL-glutamate epimerase-like enolase superfamily enzyme [Sphingobium sp. B8D3C]